jgi:glycosidase
LVVEGGRPPSTFRQEIEAQLAAYPAEHVLAQYNLLGSHDTERVATLAVGDPRRLRLLLALQFFLPGAPAIYYGDEIGLTGGKDPDSRRAFDWDPAHWDAPRQDLVRDLIRLRRSRIELRRGGLEFAEVDDEDGTIVVVRRLGGDATLLAANVSQTSHTLTLPAAAGGWSAGQEVRDYLSGRVYGVGEPGLELRLDPYDSAILFRSSP